MAALASIRDQQLEGDLEVVVVADRCRDGTAEAVARLAREDERIRVLVLDAGGAAAARNAGLQEARGEFVAFLDDDDRWLPSKLARQLAYFEDHPDVGVVGCHWAADYPGGRSAAFRDPEHVNARELLWCNFVGGCSPVIVKRAAVPPAQLRFDPAMTTCEDWDLWQRLAGHTAVAIVPEVLVRYQVHGGARLSDLLDDERQGRPAFVWRHQAEMTAVCAGYHRARQRLSTTHGWSRARLGAALPRSVPARSLWIVANESLAADIGKRRGDPGLGHRRLHGILRHMSRA
jgi:glycosyltransferase involved in cell wall biosynthesis